MTEAKDWLLIALRSQHEPIRIQKTLFLFGQQAGLRKGQKYKFRPYNWGPFSEQIYRDMDALIAEGLVERVPQPGASWASYKLTVEGEHAASVLSGGVAPGALQKLNEISGWVAKRAFGKLLEDVYTQYPKMATRSLFR